MVVNPRPVKLMDCISNGLDSATTLDIVRTVRDVCHTLHTTSVLSLLQPPPEVFALFDTVVLLSEGRALYFGPREEVLPYFAALGYECPANMDAADFLQVVSSPEGLRLLAPDRRESAPRGTAALARAWTDSALFRELQASVAQARQPAAPADEETAVTSGDGGSVAPLVEKAAAEWPADLRVRYAGSYWYHFRLTLARQYRLTVRDAGFLKARVGQSLVVAAIAGSLFSNIPAAEYTTMNGFLFFVALNGALSGFAMMPLVFAQKAVFRKHTDSLFYPASAFALAQALVLYPLQLLETVLFVTIT
jgi:hypothetical protein